MNQEFFMKAVTRRETLRAASVLAGGSALAGIIMPDSFVTLVYAIL